MVDLFLISILSAISATEVACVLGSPFVKPSTLNLAPSRVITPLPFESTWLLSNVIGTPLPNCVLNTSVLP